MACVSENLDEHELRAVPRTGLFLSAMLECSAGRLPVRIRNLSTTGAQVEVVGLPAGCTDVILLRAHLSMPASVAWRKDGRCGLKFQSEIFLDDWIPGMSTERQMKVDRRIEGIRKGLDGATNGAGRPNQLQVRIAEELGIVGRQVSNALDQLATFAPLLSRLPKPLQELEVIAQTLGHLEKLLTSDDPAIIIDNLGMEDLKRRLLR